MGFENKSAIEYAAERTTDVQIAVEESGRPWESSTAVLLYGSIHDDQCKIIVGSPEEIAAKVRPMMRPDMAKHVLDQQKQALRLLENKPRTKRNVRWVTRGAYGDWFSGMLVPRDRR